MLSPQICSRLSRPNLRHHDLLVSSDRIARIVVQSNIHIPLQRTFLRMSGLKEPPANTSASGVLNASEKRRQAGRECQIHSTRTIIAPEH
jgi:hypothetical protein